jgi:hypothetical protein
MPYSAAHNLQKMHRWKELKAKSIYDRLLEADRESFFGERPHENPAIRRMLIEVFADDA